MEFKVSGEITTSVKGLFKNLASSIERLLSTSYYTM